VTAALTVTTRDTPAGPVLEFIGALDATTAPEALAAIQALTPQPGQLLVADLTGLRFCDSSGISTLIAAHKLAHAADAAIALATVPEDLARTLGLIGLATLFTSYPTTQAAHDAWTATTQDS
jgi:anti-sigma B factor antagonist